MGLSQHGGGLGTSMDFVKVKERKRRHTNSQKDRKFYRCRERDLYYTSW